MEKEDAQGCILHHAHQEDGNGQNDRNIKSSDFHHQDQEVYRILSFDVGIKNLALCDFSCVTRKKNAVCGKSKNKDNELEELVFTINEWDVVDLSNGEKKHDLNKVVECLLAQLKNRYTEQNVTQYSAILIENQPAFLNPIMKSIQMIIFTFFHMLKSGKENICLVSATNKCKVIKHLPRDHVALIEEQLGSGETMKKKNKYAYNKKICKLMTEYVLEKHTSNSHHITPIYKCHTKRDDLSDSFLQGVYYTLITRF